MMLDDSPGMLSASAMRWGPADGTVSIECPCSSQNDEHYRS